MSHIRTFLITVIALFGTLSGGISGGGNLFAQNAWETLPVFHGGRVMPLNTFAQQVVRELCGTAHPFIVRDDAVIAEFNQFIGALREQDDPDLGETPALPTELPLQGLDRLNIERLADRIRRLIPPEGRSFSADELIFSWLSEPEVWQYIPIFPVPETDYLEEVFGISVRGNARTSPHRVSLYQLENSPRFQQRLTEIIRRHQLGQTPREPVRFDQITERLEGQSQLFRDLTFHPQRHRPTRMLSLLFQAAGFMGEQSSYGNAFETWGYLLILGDVPGRQTTTRGSDADRLTALHPTTQRWHDIFDKLHLLMRAYDQTDSRGNFIFPNALAVEKQFEILIDTLDTNLAEAAALMEWVYEPYSPDISFRPAGSPHVVDIEQLLPLIGSPDNQQHNQAIIRQLSLRYYYTVKLLRREIEAAYLALYDNGHSLRFLPVRSSLGLELGSAQNNFGVQPWATAQMILGGGEPFVRRFFDPQIAMPTTAMPATAMPTDAVPADIVPTDTAPIDTGPTAEQPPTPTPTPPTATDEQLSMEQQLFQPSAMGDWLFQVPLDDRSILGNVRTHFQTLFLSYSAPGGGYGSADFAIRAEEFQHALRPAAERVDAQRALLVDKENLRMIEQFAKTSYPGLGTPELSRLLAEYQYKRLTPFYWMWIFALLAVFLNGGAYIVSVIRRERESVATKPVSIHSPPVHLTAKGRGDKETEVQDHTNTLEEWLFMSSVVMLSLSMFVAFLGGMKRASITGWAPVTNMYETIVMVAFCAAIIGVWYALYPLVHPALKLAWVYSKFPRIGALREWHTAVHARVNARKSVSSPETTGEAAIQEPATREPATHEAADFEAQRRVSVAQRKLAWQCLLVVPRLILTCIVFYAIVLFSHEGALPAGQSFWEATAWLFETSDFIDLLAVIVSVILLLWFTPHILLTLLLLPIVLLRPSWIAAEQGIRSLETKIVGQAQQDTSGAAWLKQARNAALDRKLFIAIAAAVVFMTGLAAYLNRAEFNPDIRPIAAVLRSNFWLTVHVAAYMVGYAAALIAWLMALVSLGYAIFGRYRRTEPAFEGQKTRVLLPKACELFTPAIERLLRIALVTCIAGTVLGGRWADYSWGRFWSWDPKEVWALITILVIVVIFHGKIARLYGAIGTTVGALLATIAVIITWYGVNFLFTGSVHAYGGGTPGNATIILITFILVNVLWGGLAVLVYCTKVYGNEAED